jgi:type II secretory pathway predicted ATPase ExeA
MYYAFFGLKQPPFRITPDTDFFFEGGNRGAVLEALTYAITHGEGIVKVTGEVGSGKTMLCRVLQARLPASVETVYLANPSVSPEEILHAIAFELQLALPRDAGRLEVMHALNEYLLAKHAEHKQVVVFVEESQSMPIATLEEIRLLSNLETKQHKLLQIVLFGQPELDDNLRRTEIRQLRERITHSFSLAPLDAEEVHEYLAFRLRAAGYRGPDLFAPRVIRYVARATGGLTRRINIVADKALLAAFAANTHNVDLKHVRAAVADSEFSGAPPARRRKWGLGILALTAGLGGLSVAAALIGYQKHFADTPGPRAEAVAVQAATSPIVAAPPVASAPSQVQVEAGDAGLPDAMPPGGMSDASHGAVAQVHAAPIDSLGASAPATTGPSSTSATAAGSAGADLLEQRLLATQRWLAQEQGGIYSIQLLGSNDPQMLINYLRSLSDYIEIDKIFVYRTVANQEPSMTVLYGTFPARIDAIRSLDALPADLKSNRPYIRTVQGIRSELGLNRPS